MLWVSEKKKIKREKKKENRKREKKTPKNILTKYKHLY